MGQKELLVKDIMTTKVITAKAETPVSKVAKRMWENDLTGLPVVRGQEVIGIINDEDVITQRAAIHLPDYINLLTSYLYLENPNEVEEELKKILAIRADQLMTDEVVTIEDEATVEELATLFEEEKVNPIPVTHGENLVGIVSRADIIRLLAKEEGEMLSERQKRQKIY